MLQPSAYYTAARLEAAMKGWGTDETVLVRLLSGLNGETMKEVTEAYMTKYHRPLRVALKSELSGEFRKAAVAWVDALMDPSVTACCSNAIGATAPHLRAWRDRLRQHRPVRWL